MKVRRSSDNDDGVDGGPGQPEAAHPHRDRAGHGRARRHRPRGDHARDRPGGLVSEATAYRYFPDLASLLSEVIADQLPNAAEALEAAADSADPVARIAAATEFLLRHVLSRQGVVRTLIAATITRPGQPHARPGLRFGLIDTRSPRSATPARRRRPAALAQLKRDLAVVVSAEALFSLTDLHGLDPEQAIASIVHTATTLTRSQRRS
jgi:AcrR family transcriptional regulator